jgi:hypothetical protein
MLAPRRCSRPSRTASGRCSTTALGRGLVGQVLSVGAGLDAGAVVYGVTVHLLRIPEARQIERLLVGRLLGARKR